MSAPVHGESDCAMPSCDLRRTLQV
jgi:hypothetical protein